MLKNKTTILLNPSKGSFYSQQIFLETTELQILNFFILHLTVWCSSQNIALTIYQKDLVTWRIYTLFYLSSEYIFIELLLCINNSLIFNPVTFMYDNKLYWVLTMHIYARDQYKDLHIITHLILKMTWG